MATQSPHSKNARLLERSNYANIRTRSEVEGTSISTKTRMQQRLILLHHASNCTTASCKVTRHCAEMKAIWNHIMSDDCNDQNCSVRHCSSSRYVLSNFRQCQQSPSSRLVCCPVRKTRVRAYKTSEMI